MQVKRSGLPTIEKNRIHSSRHGGVICHGGKGTHIESEEVSNANLKLISTIFVRDACHPR